MNELQIKLTADIASFKAAMATVEQKLKNAETILEKASGEADKYRGALASLSAEYKRGAISQEQYDKQVTKLSNDLLKQQDIINNSTLEVNRLSKEYNKLGSSSLIANQNKLSQSTNNLGNSVNGLTKNVANGNSVALEFNRIVQDAPFGLIGVGNNIQQLAGNFSALSKSAGGTGAALKASFAALATGPNIALLAISALTAGFTAYQMGAFGAKETTEDLATSLDNYRKSLSESRQALLDSAKSADSELVKISSLRSIIEDETVARDKRLLAVNELKKQYPNIFENLTNEQILAGNVADSYNKLTASLVARATAETSVQKIVDLLDEERVILDKNADAIQRIQKEEAILARFREEGQTELVTIQENTIRFLKNQNPEILRLAEIESERNKLNELINKSLQESIGFTNTLKTSTSGVKDEVADLAFKYQLFLNKLNEFSDKEADKLLGFNNVGVKDIPIDIKINPEGVDLPEGIIEGLRNKIASIQKLKDVATDPERIKQYNVQLVELQAQLASFTQEAVKNTSDFSNQLTDVFSQFAAGVVSSLDISNSSLRGFVTTLVAAAPKIIGAIRAISAANKAKSDQAVADGTKEALVGGAVVAVDGAKALGPLGLALLPVFLAGTFALISGFLNRGKAGGGGGGGSASAGVGSTFTNAKPPNVGGFASPARSGVDTSNVSSGFGSMQLDIKLQGVVSGNDLVFIYDQAVIKKGNS